MRHYQTAKIEVLDLFKDTVDIVVEQVERMKQSKYQFPVMSGRAAWRGRG